MDIAQINRILQVSGLTFLATVLVFYLEPDGGEQIYQLILMSCRRKQYRCNAQTWISLP